MFDLVFMMDVLEHMGKHEQVLTLSAVSKLLAQDGRLIVSVPNANSTLGLRWRYGDWTHEVSFTELSLDFLLLNTGFRDVNFLPYEFIARPRLPLIPRPSILPWAFQRIARILRRMEAVGELGANGWKIPLSLNLLVECRKDNA
jgi:SAM-dependent methyltransferase